MSRPSKILIKESEDELKQYLNSTNIPKSKLKIRSLILFKSGKFKTQDTIAYHLGIGPSTLRLWYKNYSLFGLEEFIKVKPKGKPKSVINTQLHLALEQRVKDSTNPLKGYWDVVNWVKENYDTEINYQTLRSYLIKHFKTKLKVPRKSHYKSNELATDAFLKNT